MMPMKTTILLLSWCLLIANGVGAIQQPRAEKRIVVPGPYQQKPRNILKGRLGSSALALNTSKGTSLRATNAIMNHSCSTPKAMAISLRGGAVSDFLPSPESVAKVYGSGIALIGAHLLALPKKDDPLMGLFYKAKGLSLLSFVLAPLLVLQGKNMTSQMAVAVSTLPRYLFFVFFAMVRGQCAGARFEFLLPSYTVCAGCIASIFCDNAGSSTCPTWLPQPLLGAKIIAYLLLIAGSGIYLTTELSAKALGMDSQNKSYVKAWRGQGIADFIDGVVKMAMLPDYSPAQAFGLGCVVWSIMSVAKVLLLDGDKDQKPKYKQQAGILLGGLYMTFMD